MLSRGGSPLTDAIVDDVQRAVALLPLPPDYRAFLLAANGGATEDGSILFFGVNTTPKQKPSVLSNTDHPPEVMWLAAVRADPIEGADDDDQPRGSLVIAHDGPRLGQVFFWNDARWTPFFLERHEENTGPLKDMFAQAYADFFGALEPVAKSFAELLERVGGTLVDPMPAVDESDVAAFEARTKAKLPAEYRRFISQTNGARVVDGKTIALEEGVTGRVTSICPVRRATPQPTDVREELHRLAAKLPKGTVPIAGVKGTRTFVLDTKDGSVLEWAPKKEPKRVAASFGEFLRAAESGGVDVSTNGEEQLTASGYRAFVAEQLDDLTPALVRDLKERVFSLAAADGATSLDFEVFPEPLDGKLPIVGYHMNGDSQVTTNNVAILPDVPCVIPARFAAPFHDADIGNTDGVHAELVMEWFVRGWKEAGGETGFPRPASIMIHDEDERVVLRRA